MRGNKLSWPGWKLQSTNDGTILFVCVHPHLSKERNSFFRWDNFFFVLSVINVEKLWRGGVTISPRTFSPENRIQFVFIHGAHSLFLHDGGGHCIFSIALNKNLQCSQVSVAKICSLVFFCSYFTMDADNEGQQSFLARMKASINQRRNNVACMCPSMCHSLRFFL